MLKIIDIQTHDGTPIDEYHKKRIGRVVDSVSKISTIYGIKAVMPYITDKNGDSLMGKALYTSPIINYTENEDNVVLETENSIYFLEKMFF